jgi:hypothetical protein
MYLKIAVMFLLALTLLAACQSKYALHFYRIENHSRQELKSQDCYYVPNYRISSSPKTMNLAPGQGNLLIVNQSGVNPKQKDLKVDFFSTEGRLTYNTYVNLPVVIKKDSVNMDENSVCWMTGDYEVADSLRMYQCREGYLLIDSVKSSKFFLTMKAKFVNIIGDSLVFSGDMRPKKKKELFGF